MLLLIVATTQRGLAGSESITSAMAGQILSIGGDGCGNDSDCKGSGVCVNAKCICFEDSQCKTECDKSIGKCR